MLLQDVNEWCTSRTNPTNNNIHDLQMIIKRSVKETTRRRRKQKEVKREKLQLSYVQDMNRWKERDQDWAPEFIFFLLPFNENGTNHERNSRNGVESQTRSLTLSLSLSFLFFSFLRSLWNKEMQDAFVFCPSKLFIHNFWERSFFLLPFFGKITGLERKRRSVEKRDDVVEEKKVQGIEKRDLRKSSLTIDISRPAAVRHFSLDMIGIERVHWHSRSFFLSFFFLVLQSRSNKKR